MKIQTFETTNDFLDAVKSLKNIESDYKLAKFLNVNKAAVSSWRHGKSFLDDSICFRVAAALDIQPEYVVSCIHAERAKTDFERSMWSRMAAAFGAAACAVLVVGILAPLPFF
jgi:transcriptional regulator with XRE-family HTH domain